MATYLSVLSAMRIFPILVKTIAHVPLRSAGLL